MNATELNSTEIWAPYNQVFSTLSYQDLWITVSVTILQIIILAALIRRETWTSPLESRTKKQILSYTNILLIVMILSNLFLQVFNRLYADTSEAIPTVIYCAFLTFWTCALEFAMMLYMYRRGLPVIQLILPSIPPFLVVFMILFGILQISLLIFTVLLVISNYLPTQLSEDSGIFGTAVNGHIMAVDASMIFFDCLVILVYAMYLQRVSGGPNNVEKLVILSRYGIVSCVVLEIWQLSIVLYNVWTNAALPECSLTTYTILLRFYDLSPLAYLFLQLAMKWSLMRDDERTAQEKINRVVKAKAMATSESSGSERKSYLTASDCRPSGTIR
ncbi:hypothetical protein BCR33DRAFT_846765 [Rhizoclosmatium globosum]|uniref:Uncharacterized protein n=1 Tax=Rhizoclosmatium globosum TaxID=329046 RepID=A0A1Y2CTP8_9FUNG|nr:hypothetical protein BCR33DRAFT_846765 [Rhizoclosmatium globosum]|eukprot:ORY50214.1 hypothetical protein BCR33DRAFT_846765 [Rhizoclosmatium globosum]